jgi:hypothetical protein
LVPLLPAEALLSGEDRLSSSSPRAATQGMS